MYLIFLLFHEILSENFAVYCILEIFCVILFLWILRILKFCKNLLTQKIIVHVRLHAYTWYRYDNQLNGHGQDAG